MKTIAANRRTLVGTRRANALRRKGLIPGVLYGKGYSRPIQIQASHLNAAIRENGRTRPCWLQLEDQTVPVMIAELQEKTLGGEIIHIDFKQIDMKSGVLVSVPLVLAGRPASGQAILLHHELPIRCLPTEVPAHLEISVDGLAEGGELRVKDLALPAGVTAQLDEHEPLVRVEPVEPDVRSEAATAVGSA